MYIIFRPPIVQNVTYFRFCGWRHFFSHTERCTDEDNYDTCAFPTSAPGAVALLGFVVVYNSSKLRMHRAKSAVYDCNC